MGALTSRNYETHDFYCLNCGKRNVSLFRSRGRLRETGHRKVLYCPHCKKTLNHIECRNDMEAFEFKLAFEAGEFKEEAVASMSYVEGAGRIV